ncbi:hypothetical protein [Sphingomonas pokkalii]|uniref:Uncharacterized protein n=1 Tax=Sphingomonas pokkalii TaxID=2175090 RepID=A0A2U0SJ87_9SPHN|nr:hypothetical protein [Sphingomonas pokkalii]PVX31400.1 hypothetical protein DD559_07635 [Sphingomonas pokkalii]
MQEEDGFTRWIEACAAGEMLGIASAALWWVTIDRVDLGAAGGPADWLLFIGKAASGLALGLVLGSLQSWALKRQFPALNTRLWVIATTIVSVALFAVAAWYSVFLPFDQQSLVPVAHTPFETAITSAGFGVALGILLGIAQAVVLHGAARRAFWWILASALGWGAALPCIYLAASVGSSAPGSLEIAARGVVGGVASGIVLAGITGMSFAVMRLRVRA